ncbi:class I SAM-dependent methyltransferase [Spongiibacter sp. KMU-158]|uniref:Class I SAM-dependent methyltransferase n=1 Tax=Spongiibacter pelagi TaxID=2760804 RepID=A0A927GVN0_9GAMM|nr:methyltransferase [Spongiibacter pelagi]MBD2858841.1 class I SAM-dependent methyltransferase [Spongiibacter pelagi]
MKDSALQAIYRELENSEGSTWWLVDEHLQTPLPRASADCPVWTNRCDSAAQLQQAGFIVTLNDFDLPQASVDRVLYRVSKEKLLVHYLINQSLAHLQIGGVLWLAGKKNEGLKTYADKAAKLVGGKAEIKKLDGEAYLARIEKYAEPSSNLPDGNYPQLQQIADDPVLYSKPGIFGWQKIDRGSALLIEQLPAFLQGLSRKPQTLLDLGCGYGYLSVMAAKALPEADYILTDNNATALLAAEKNCAEHTIRACCVLADCASGITEKVDVVLCNPPFHQGFSVDGDLTDRFIAAAKQRLKPGGQALFVVNQFIPLERKAQGIFASSERLYEGEGFHIIQLTG